MLSSFTTPLNPCVLEGLCTPDASDETLLALGTYHLDVASGAKTGAVGLVRARASPPPSLSALLPDVPGAAVFDGHWQCEAPLARSPLFLSSAHGGELRVYALVDGLLSHVEGSVVDIAGGDGNDVSCLACAWAETPSTSGAPTRVFASLSDGRVWCGDVGGSGGADTGRSWAAHDLFGSPSEVWAAVTCPHSRDVVWSGGDDAALRAWDVREPCTRPTFTSRAHTAGVTSIAWSPHDEHIVATGSYDEHLLMWDDRCMGGGSTTGGSRAAAPLSDTCMGGGVWRLKWRPVGFRGGEGGGGWSHALAAACMYGGVRVVDAAAVIAEGGGGSSLALPTLAHYGGHGDCSIAYGVEWLRGAAAGEPLLASCAFYQREVHLWEGREGEGASAATVNGACK